ncbi:proline iminopeptidase-family hydrolase [uncultured Flavobacterium sp.]|uniref:proline iminopeptidase-family hydrolase n=1 Tax=uncultured Flavobacterium sp. TaxID=165435 RepID=UPI0030CA168F|tara:strand:+ start:973 stop:1983 length:1011 start_codon:yes stop_codon:yes gene_type:complete
MKKIVLLSIIAFFFSNCKKEETTSTYYKIDSTKIQDGGVKVIPITANGKTFNVWTKRVGNNPKIKVLLLNGGPGATHEYFECFENFMPAEGIEFIYYDQLGCGNSDNPNDIAYWDLARYVEEVEQVRIALNLNATNCYVLGHSWGGILAMEYALKYQSNIKGLIISNMMSSCPEYGKYADDVLAKQMNPTILAQIQKIEDNKDFSNPKYMELLLPNFYEEHILRLPSKNWPEPVNRSFAKINQSLYVTMQGPSEFGIAGNLEFWDRTNDLKNITIPSLVIAATHDTMDPIFMEKMSTLLPNGSFLLCKNGSHMALYDDQQAYFKGLISFLKNNNQL